MAAQAGAISPSGARMLPQRFLLAAMRLAAMQFSTQRRSSLLSSSVMRLGSGASSVLQAASFGKFGLERDPSRARVYIA